MGAPPPSVTTLRLVPMFPRSGGFLPTFFPPSGTSVIALATVETLAPEQMAPLDNRRRGDTIFTHGGSEGPRLTAGLSGWQQPFQEELCDGYASLFLSSPGGLVSRRRVS
jgi:hypothetical protein